MKIANTQVDVSMILIQKKKTTNNPSIVSLVPEPGQLIYKCGWVIEHQTLGMIVYTWLFRIDRRRKFSYSRRT